MDKRKAAAWLALAALGASGAVVTAQQKAVAPVPRVAGTDHATIDSPIKDFTLKDIAHEAKDTDKTDAASISLSSYKNKKAIILFFMSEKCGTTWRYEKRVGKLQQKYGKDVAFLGVRCSANDTPQELCKFAEAKNFDMPLLNDDKGQLATYFKIYCTPSFALIDKQGVLRYFGSFDDAANEAQVTKTLLPNAVSSVLTDKVVSIKTNRPFG